MINEHQAMGIRRLIVTLSVAVLLLSVAALPVVAQHGNDKATISVLAAAVDHIRSDFSTGSLWVETNYERLPTVPAEIAAQVAEEIGAKMGTGENLFGCLEGQPCATDDTILILSPPSIRGDSAKAKVHIFLYAGPKFPPALTSTEMVLSRRRGKWEVTEVTSKEIG